MTAPSAHRRRVEDGAPDPAFYAAIGGDAALKQILDTFYDRVFVDQLLAHFFERTDKPTLKAKQFTFLKQRFTGERNIYMGQRPRNAHHWMVISDADFDHRQVLLRETLEGHGLSPEHVRQWLAVEEVFRRQIVKSEPWRLFYRGVETFWFEDVHTEVATVAMLCDECQGEIDVGQSFWIVGERVFCAKCRPTKSPHSAANSAA